MKTRRAFIAVDIGPDIRAKLRAFQQELKKAKADVRWVKPENMHLTLAFLGNVPLEKFQPLESALDENLQPLEPFRLTVQGTGIFGRRSRPSVVWAGIAECPALLELQQRVVASVEAAEIPFDNRRYRPHLTLGRFKSLHRLDPLFQSLETQKDSLFGTVDVHAATLIESELNPTGAAYTVLHRTEFQSR